jgi:hypothetical protein
MLGKGDLLVLILLAGALLMWTFRRLWSWFSRPSSHVSASPIPTKGEAVQLLDADGFEWVRGKEKIPIKVSANERTFDSRLFIDGLVEKQGKRYIVKISREQKPIRLTGAAFRDELMPFQLIYNTDGIAYVDLQKHEVKLISFEIEQIKHKKPFDKRWWPYLVSMLLGAWLTFALFH